MRGVRLEWGDGELVKPLPAINSSSPTGQTRAAKSLKVDRRILFLKNLKQETIPTFDKLLEIEIGNFRPRL